MKHNPDHKKHARQLRKDMTPWERKLWYLFLKDYPLRFQRQKCIDNYIVDFYCFQAKLVIELDGGGHYEPKAERYDQNRTQVLEGYGLKVLRFCNTDIDHHFYSVCTVIDEEVKKRVEFAPPGPLGHPPHKCGGKIRKKYSKSPPGPLGHPPHKCGGQEGAALFRRTNHV